MVCDAHIHYIPKELAEYTSFYRGVWSDKDKLFFYLEKNKIDKALLVYPSTDACLKIGQAKVCQIYNQALEAVIKQNSGIVAAGLVNLDDSSLALQVESLAKRGFGAINLASSYQGKFLVKELIPLFEAAQELGLPIFIHPQTINPIGFERVKDPLLMPVLEYSFDLSMFMGLLMTEAILENFKVKFIFSSLGGVIPFLKSRFDRVYAMLRQREIVKDLGGRPSSILSKIYADTSGASLANIKIALDFFGPDRILWGSDYPVSSPIEENLKKLDQLGEVKNKVVYQNFEELFK